MSFSELGLNQSLLDTLARLGYTQPTPIQARAIPAVLAGDDLLAAAQTGTGKTAAFTLPILEQLLQQPNQQQAPTVLVLTPTRELAAQVEESVRTYAGQDRLRSAVIFGGVSPVPQIKQFKRGLDVLIATPGRLLDHAQQGNVDLSRIKTFVLDEADRMLDMGFIHDIRRVIKLLPEQRQNLMFSATFSPEIRKLARTILRDPQEIDVAPRNSTAELIEQKLIFVPKHQKRELLSWLIGSRNWRQVLVFTRTKHGANRLCKQLSDDGLPAAALHGNKSQAARTKALKGFKDGQVRVLVATDIAARGIDIDQLPHVINYEIPNIPADYIHRIGRTGRAGTEGEALSLISADERDYLRDITKLLGRDIPELKLENFYIEEDKAASKPQPGNRSAKPGHKPGGRSPRSSGRKAGNNSGRPSRKSRQRDRTRRPA